VIRIIHTKHRFQILSSIQSFPFMKIWVTKGYLKNAWVVLLKIIMRVLMIWSIDPKTTWSYSCRNLCIHRYLYF